MFLLIQLEQVTKLDRKAHSLQTVKNESTFNA